MNGLELVQGAAEHMLTPAQTRNEAVFRINGRVCRWWGSGLPFKDGDLLIAAGYHGSSGALHVDAIAVPQAGLFFSSPHKKDMIDGTILMSIGVAIML